MNCQTKIGPEKICGHSVTSHEGDESGMGGAEPCNMCGCSNFTREPIMVQLGTAERIREIAGMELMVAENLPIIWSGPHISVMKVDGGMVEVQTTMKFTPDPKDSK